MDTKKMLALLIIVIAVAAGLGMSGLLSSSDEEEKITPSVELADNYILIVQMPHNEDERAMVAALSALSVHNGFHPIFLLTEDGKLDDHSLWTIDHSNYSDATKYLFASDPAILESVSKQVKNVVLMPFNKEDFNTAMQKFIGFNGKITVESYKEALWVAPLAAQENKTITLEKSTFETQEQVWDRLFKEDVKGKYVVVTNPEDWMGKEKFYTVFQDKNASYHIPSLSLVAGELAAYHRAYVLTDIDVQTNFSDEFKDMLPQDNPHLNDIAISTLLMLRNISRDYGGINYIAPVGSAEAVPQFELPDYSGSEPDYTSSDVVFGFLDKDDYTMDAAVGRIVNYNVQGAFNMIARTWGYDKIDKEVTAQSDEITRTEEWRTHGSSWNGYEVADIRLQNSPGAFYQHDMEDEGYTCDYTSTTGIGETSDFYPATNIATGLQVSGMVAYRGHGSWHGSIYQWGYFVVAGAGVVGIGDDNRGHLEGTVARTLFLPPQTACVVSCENAKIHGLSYGGDPIDMDRVFATNYLYAGAVGLVAATEVSYSNVGQDGYVVIGQGTGSNNWDLNDLWYAAFWDNILDGAFTNGTHTGPETDNGHALMNAENRYMLEHTGISPMKNPGSDGANWKETAMFALYGDPAFKPYGMIEGPNNYDPWH